MKSTKRLKPKTRVDYDHLELIKKENKLISSFRWIVEQAFAHLDKARRLIVNYERNRKMHEGFVKLQFIRLNLRKLVVD